MIERVIRSAQEAGADDFYVVTGCHRERVRTFLNRLTDRTGIRTTPIVNGDWEKANGMSVLKAREYRHEPFLLLMADYLFATLRQAENALLADLGDELQRPAEYSYTGRF